jgi:copper chaperone CopZ
MNSIRLIIAACMLFITTCANAQIQSVSLQASGLTCSMCSRAIYKALQKVPAVSEVQEDIEHTSYHVHFSDPSQVSLRKLLKAVTGAGFTVEWMEVNANFNHAEVASDSTLKVNGLVFRFVDIHKQILTGKTKLLVVDANYLPEKDRKKYSGAYESGPDGDKGENFYHVTLIRS